MPVYPCSGIKRTYSSCFVKFRKNPTKEQLIEKLEQFSGVPQELNLPSAPKQFIRYMQEDDRPQVQLDVDYETVWVSM